MGSSSSPPQPMNISGSRTAAPAPAEMVDVQNERAKLVDKPNGDIQQEQTDHKPYCYIPQVTMMYKCLCGLMSR